MLRKNILLPFYFLSFILFLSSCATTLKVQVTRPAKLNLNGAKTISVLPFENSNDNLIDIYFFQSSNDSFYDYYTYQIYIKNRESYILKYLKQELENGLHKSPYISLVSHIPVENALKYGNKNPADVFMEGEMETFKVRDVETKTKVPYPEDDSKLKDRPIEIIYDKGVPIYYYDYSYARDVVLNFNYKIIDGHSKEIINYDSLYISRSSSSYEDPNDLPDVFSMISTDLDQFVSTLLQYIQPYDVYKSIKLLEDKTKNPAMKNADSLAREGYLKESYRAFAEVYVDNQQLEAGYNAGMILLALGELGKAEAIMEDVYNRYRDNRALEALYDIRNEINYAKNLESQINKTN